MNTRLIRILALKDLKLFFRNGLFAMVTLLVLILLPAVYYLLPGEAEQFLTVGLYSPQNLPELVDQLSRRRIQVKPVESHQALLDQIEADELDAGISIDQAQHDALLAGQPSQIRLLLPAGAPREFIQSMMLLVRTAANEASYTFSGITYSLESEEEVLGPDRVGEPVAARDRLLPMFAIVLLLTETMGLAGLITEEVEQRTLRALRLTPASLSEIFTAKGIMSVGLAFIQTVLLVAITGGLSNQPLLVLLVLLLGALLVTGIGFLIASISRGYMSAIAYGTLALVLFGLPAFNLLFPGTASRWVSFIPTYYLVNALHLLMNFHAGLNEIALSLGMLAGMALAVLVLGVLALNRRLKWA
jgi:ABC-2 type transport system permease protein